MVRFGKLEFIAFVSGAVLMMFELAAARILAPSIGSSTYVWTSVIGVIIAALSIGYWSGGRIADARKKPADVVILCFFACVSVVFVLLSYVSVLAWVVGVADDARLQGMLASLILFAPTSFLLGVLSPYLAKFAVTSLDSTGSSIANLSSLNSIGGIVGTFLTGFVLFGYIGSRETLGIVALMLLVCSWLLIPNWRWMWRVGASFVIVVAVGLPVQVAAGLHIDTPSAHYVIYEDWDPSEPQSTRGIASGPTGIQSGIYVNQPDKLLFWYTKQLAQLVEAAPNKQNILILGGGTFTLPQHLANKYPSSMIDVVEIDPTLESIAKKYFEYKSPSNVTLHFADARSFINESSKRYDVVIVDIYNDTSVPFSLMTREYGEAINRLLTVNGVVGVNMIAGQQGACRKLLQALDAPYRRHLPQVTYSEDKKQTVRANMVVAYSRQPVQWTDANTLSLPKGVSYSDNFAPAERLQQACIDES